MRKLAKRSLAQMFKLLIVYLAMLGAFSLRVGLFARYSTGLMYSVNAFVSETCFTVGERPLERLPLQLLALLDLKISGYFSPTMATQYLPGMIFH
jgi:thiamine transporter ThiT